MRWVSPESGSRWPGHRPGPVVGAPVGTIPDRVLLHHPGRGQDPGVLRGKQEERGTPDTGRDHHCHTPDGHNTIIWGSQDIGATEEGLPSTTGDGWSPEPVDHKAGILQPGPRHFDQQQVCSRSVFSLFTNVINRLERILGILDHGAGAKQAR